METYNTEHYLKKVESKTIDVGMICEAARISKHGISGDSFRHWITGIYKDGVYYCAEGHTIKTMIASHPEAELVKGCQSAVAHGNPVPKVKNGEWIELPPKAYIEKVEPIIKWIESHILEVVKNQAEKIKAETERELEEKKKSKNKMISNWA